MSRQIILCLVSEQTLPNVLFIKAHTSADEFWFLETSKTKKDHKGNAIKNACQLPGNKIFPIEVEPDSFDFQLPENWKLNDDDLLLVNLTCGTKLMSLSIYEYFKLRVNTQFFYIPVDNSKARNIITGEVLRPPDVDVNTYLNAHGFSCIYGKHNRDQKKLSYTLFEQVVNAGSAKNVFDIQSIKADPAHPDYKFYSGEWFEIYLYNWIKQSLSLHESQILHGVKLKHHSSELKSESDHEVDVMFIYKNKLYIIECKVYDTTAKSGVVYHALQKIAIINRSLGLHARAFICILSSTESVSKERLNYLKALAGIVEIFNIQNFQSNKTVHQLFKL